MEAVLEAIRSGNAAGAAEAGRLAAQETSQAWNISMGIIAEADETTTQIIEDRATHRTDHAILEATRSTDETLSQSELAWLVV